MLNINGNKTIPHPVSPPLSELGLHYLFIYFKKVASCTHWNFVPELKMGSSRDLWKLCGKTIKKLPRLSVTFKWKNRLHGKHFKIALIWERTCFGLKSVVTTVFLCMAVAYRTWFLSRNLISCTIFL